MELISVRDLTKPKAIEALRTLRSRHFPQSAKDEEDFHAVYDKVGGRLAFLTKVAKEKDMIAKCNEICDSEKTWLLVCAPPVLRASRARVPAAAGIEADSPWPEQMLDSG